MILIDTHTHLYLPEFDEDRDESVRRAVETGISKMLMPNIDVNSVDAMLAAEKRYSGICFSMVGLHPTSVKEDYIMQLDQLEDISRKHNFVAIGEIGIDLYWDKTFIREQTEAFTRQLILAMELNLPVVIHSREAFTEIFQVLEGMERKNLRGVFHAFSGDRDTAERAVKLGFKLGIGGIVTFRNSGLDNVIRDIEPEHILIETDSPYLAPSPHRGRRNESAYAAIICRKLAEIYKSDDEEIASITTYNAKKLFNLQ